jgi:hypothetical protein
MHSRCLAVCLILVGFTRTGHSEEEKAGPDDNKAPEGFGLLFNGKDLTGWQGVVPIVKRAKMSPEERDQARKTADEKVLPHWKVVNGILVNDGQGDNLQTIKDYGDFELHADWKIEPKGDSGIYLRGVPQVQIWDSATLMGNLAKDKDKGSGGLWNNKKNNQPLKSADKPAGEWNTFHIVIKGDKVTVRLNGELVVDQIALENIWESGKPLPTVGPIELQRHPKQDGTLGKLWFKNVYIKELIERKQ